MTYSWQGDKLTLFGRTDERSLLADRAVSGGSDPGHALRTFPRVDADRRRAGAGDRPRPARRVSLAQHRSRPRRPFDRRRRRQGPSARGLLRRRRRRPLEDHRCRQQLGAGHRRPDQQFVGRRRGRVGFESRRRLHRHGRELHSRQHHARRRRLQVHRRRQDVGARRLPRRPMRSRRFASIPTNPDIVYVASFGLYYGPSEERGVFKSTDGGKTWKPHACSRIRAPAPSTS